MSEKHCGTCAHLREGVCVRWDRAMDARGRRSAGARVIEAWVAEVRSGPGWGEVAPKGPIARGCPEWRERTVSEAVTV